MNIYCCCLHKVNKLVEIKNEPRDLIRREAIETEGLVIYYITRISLYFPALIEKLLRVIDLKD